MEILVRVVVCDFLHVYERDKGTGVVEVFNRV